MTWLLSRITNNPAVLAYVAAACFVAGVASGAAPAWTVQGWRLDALRARYASFVAQTKILGEQAEKEAFAKSAQDKLKKERYDAQHKKDVAANADLAKRLRESYSSQSTVSQLSPSTGRPDLACFARTELDAAIGGYQSDVLGITEKGSAATIDLNIGKAWVKESGRQGDMR